MLGTYKKNIMKNLKYLFIIVVAIVLFASCSDDGIEGAKENGIVGTWEQADSDESGMRVMMNLTFNSNGTGSSSVDSNNPDNGNSSDFTWETEGGTILIIITEEWGNETMTYSISGNKLTIFPNHEQESIPDVWTRK